MNNQVHLFCHHSDGIRIYRFYLNDNDLERAKKYQSSDMLIKFLLRLGAQWADREEIDPTKPFYIYGDATIIVLET